MPLLSRKRPGGEAMLLVPHAKRMRSDPTHNRRPGGASTPTGGKPVHNTHRSPYMSPAHKPGSSPKLPFKSPLGLRTASCPSFGNGQGGRRRGQQPASPGMHRQRYFSTHEHVAWLNSLSKDEQRTLRLQDELAALDSELSDQAHRLHEAQFKMTRMCTREADLDRQLKRMTRRAQILQSPL